MKKVFLSVVCLMGLIQSYSQSKSIQVENLASAIAFSPEKKLAASASGNIVSIYSTEGHIFKSIIVKVVDPITYETKVGDVSALAFSPTGDSIAIATKSGSILLGGTSTELLKTICKDTKIGPMSALAISPNGSWVLGSSGNKLSLWDVNGYGILQEFDKPNTGYYLVDISTSGSSGDGGGGVRVLPENTSEEDKKRTVKVHTGTIKTLGFSANNEFILTGGADSTIILWNIDGKLIQRFEGHKGGINSISFAPDNKSFVSGSADHKAILWSIDGKKLKEFKESTSSLKTVAFSPKGDKIIAGSESSEVFTWSISGKLLSKEKISTQVLQVAFAKDDQKILITQEKQ